VTFEGEFDTVTAAGIAPMPIQRPIPVWFGGSSPRADERIGRLADGWFPQSSESTAGSRWRETPPT
jgi:alkanesulfonate monooxygenase SsuD/methylene tetrahydromethanopterin reductase-like flavin-dependent oxidoreductase (luciferase family)